MRQDGESKSSGVSRRQFLQGAGGAAAGSVLIGLPQLAQGDEAKAALERAGTEAIRSFGQQHHARCKRPTRPADRDAGYNAAPSRARIAQSHRRQRRSATAARAAPARCSSTAAA